MLCPHFEIAKVEIFFAENKGIVSEFKFLDNVIFLLTLMSLKI